MFNTIKVNNTDTNYTHSIFDISEYNSGAIYANLSAALDAVPQNKQQGGMTVKFIQQITPARYSVVKTENLETEPTGTLLSEAPYIESGTYDESQLSTIFSTLPSSTGAGNALTYYVAVTVDETTTYTSWVITKVQNSKNKYIQARCMAQNFTTDVTQWQGVDDEPTVGSDNLVKSGGIYNIPQSNLFIKGSNYTGALNEIIGISTSFECTELYIYVFVNTDHGIALQSTATINGNEVNYSYALSKNEVTIGTHLITIINNTYGTLKVLCNFSGNPIIFQNQGNAYVNLIEISKNDYILDKINYYRYRLIPIIDNETFYKDLIAISTNFEFDSLSLSYLVNSVNGNITRIKTIMDGVESIFSYERTDRDGFNGITNVILTNSNYPEYHITFVFDYQPTTSKTYNIANANYSITKSLVIRELQSLETIESNIQNIEDTINGKDTLIAEHTNISEEGKFLYRNGGTLPNPSYNISEYVDLTDLEISKIEIYGSANQNGVASYCFYKGTETKTPIEYNPAVTQNKMYLYTINRADFPSEATCIRATFQYGQGYIKTLFHQDGILDIINQETSSDDVNIAEDYFTDKTCNVHKYIDPSNDNITDREEFCSSNYLEVTENTNYIVGSFDSCMNIKNIVVVYAIFYNANKQLIPNSYIQANSFKTPASCSYIRLDFYSEEYSSLGVNSFNNLIMQKGTRIIFPFERGVEIGKYPYSILRGTTWLTLGDSITENNFRSTNNYHDFIKGVTGCNVINWGKSGAGYRHGLDSLQIEQVFDVKIAEFPNISPSFITVMAGINDMEFDRAPIGNMSSKDNTTLLGCIYLLLEKLKTYFPTTIVGILSPIPEIHFKNTLQDSDLRHEFTIEANSNIAVGDIYTCKTPGGWTARLEVLEVGSEGLTIITDCDMRYCPVYSGTLTKVSGSGNDTVTFTAVNSNMLHLFVKGLKEFCSYNNIPFLDLYHFSGLHPWETAMNEKYFKYKDTVNADGLHPNYWGHRYIYPKILQFVETISQ